MNQEHVVSLTIQVRYELHISLWDAFKLRLMGGEAIKQYIERLMDERNFEAKKLA